MVSFRYTFALLAILLLAGCGPEFQTTRVDQLSVVKPKATTPETPKEEPSDKIQYSAEMTEALALKDKATTLFEASVITGASWKLIGSTEILATHLGIVNGVPATPSTEVIEILERVVLNLQTTQRSYPNCYPGPCPDLYIDTGKASIKSLCEEIQFNSIFEKTVPFGMPVRYQTLGLSRGSSTSTICNSTVRDIVEGILEHWGVNSLASYQLPLGTSGRYLYVGHGHAKTYVFVRQ